MTDEQIQNEFSQFIAVICNEPPGPLRDEAMARLFPFVQNVARRICRKYRADKNTARLFIDEINGELLLPGPETGRSKLQSFDMEKSFPGWLYRVVENLFKDCCRRQSRQKFHSLGAGPDNTAALLDQIAASAEGDSHSAADWEQPFSNDDLGRIETWLVRDRFVLLVGSNLWHKIPAQFRTKWAEEWGIPDSVPSAETLAAAEADDRVRQLAAETGENWPPFKMHWYRKRRWLLTLDFMRGLLDE